MRTGFYSKEGLVLMFWPGAAMSIFDYEFDDDNSGARAATDFELTGPYIGVRAVW